MDLTNSWIQEAVLEFLKSPLYEQPVMDFLDDRCLIFDMEEENKLEYTEIHEEFKELVDELIAGYLEDLGISVEDFYETVCAAGPDKLTNLVISTVLLADDFPQFRALMMKRNLELSNQVLEQLEGPKMEQTTTKLGKAVGGSDVKKSLPTEARKLLPSTKRNSSEESCDTDISSELKELMADDEDPELAWAIAESLQQTCANQLEVAELEQAIALSLALAKESKPTASRDTMDQSCASGSQPLKESERDAPEGKAHPSYMVTEDGKSLKPLQAKGFPINSHAFPASSAQLLTDMTPNIASNPCTKDDNVQKATDLTSEEILTSEQKYEHKTRGCEEPKTNIESGNVKISRRGTSSGITPIKGLGNVRAAAAQAAKAQKAIIAAQKDSKLQTPSREDMPRFPKKQRAWLTDQCRKLVSEKKGVRNVQLEEYKDKSKGASKQSASISTPQTKVEPEVESERVELQNKLAQKLRKDLAHMPSSSRD